MAQSYATYDTVRYRYIIRPREADGLLTCVVKKKTQFGTKRVFRTVLPEEHQDALDVLPILVKLNGEEYVAKVKAETK